MPAELTAAERTRRAVALTVAETGIVAVSARRPTPAVEAIRDVQITEKRRKWLKRQKR